jgi:hypothetical protein
MGKVPQNCINCEYSKNTNTPEHPEQVELICRRYAPAPRDTSQFSTWPQVKQGDWCGEYKPVGWLQKKG